MAQRAPRRGGAQRTAPRDQRRPGTPDGEGLIPVPGPNQGTNSAGALNPLPLITESDANDIIEFLNALNDDGFDREIPARVPSGLTPGGLIR